MPVGGDVTQFFMGLMGFLGESLRAGSAAGLERPLGLWLSRPRREPDGSVLPGARRFSTDGWTPRRPTSSAWWLIRFGEGWEHSGRHDGSGFRATGSALAALCLVDVRVLPDPPGPSVGLHDGMLDAVGVGLDVVLACCAARAVPQAGCPFLLSSGACPSALARALSTGVSDPVRADRPDASAGRPLNAGYGRWCCGALWPVQRSPLRFNLRGAASGRPGAGLGFPAGGDSALADGAAG